MKDRSEKTPLRKRAEKILSKKQEAAEKAPSADMKKLIHELRVHQIELEMQNDELRKAQEEIEASRSRYTDLYDFAPVGYFTLNNRGVIVEANLTGASLLGIERTLLLKTPFSRFIMPKDRSLFWDSQRKVFQIPGRQTCRLRLKREGNKPLWVRLESVAAEDPDGKLTGVRLALIDITESKGAEEELRKAHDEMEIRVKERTRELMTTNNFLQSEITERKNAEEEARRDQSRLIMALEAADMVTWEWDIATRSIRYSENIETIVHGTAVEPYCSLDSLMPKIHPEDRGRLVQALDQTTKEGTPFECEYRVHMLDGTYRWILGKGKRVFLEGGKPVRVLGLSMDVTERKRDEEERKKYQNLIQEERDRLAALVNSITDEVWFADTQKKFTLANPSALREFGLDSAGDGVEVERFTASLEVYRPDGRLRPIEEAPALRSLQGEVIRNEEEIVRTPGKGELRYRQASSAPVRNTLGDIVGSVSVVRDITERKQAEKKLNESERLYRAIGESIDYGIWVCDPEGRNTYASESFLKLVGFTQDQCSEFGWGDVLHPEDAERTIAAWKECVRTGGKWDIEHRYRGAEGKWHPILARGVPVRDEQGRVIYWAGINLDISGLKQMEEDLRRSRDELESRVQERTEELARSQHRLQQLASQLLLAQEKERRRVAVELHDGLLSELAATKYLLEGKIMLLQKGNLSDPGELKRVVDILATTMQEARRIMNNLHPSVLDELGLIAALHWFFGEYQKAYPHIRVETKIEVSEKDISESIRVVIFRVLQEALNNFAKHGKGDLVDLSLTKSDTDLALVIRDNGQGFDVENVQKGLGLESMKERIDLSGGEFQIKSIVGQGTSIRAIWRT